jgi:hypothetical protein
MTTMVRNGQLFRSIEYHLQKTEVESICRLDAFLYNMYHLGVKKSQDCDLFEPEERPGSVAEGIAAS